MHRYFLRFLRVFGLLAAAVLQLLPLQASAHLMMPQRGTLNFVDGSAYLVMSLPVSAFPYSNDNENHLLSAQSFTKHQQRMAADVEAQVQLLDAQGPLQLEGTFLNFTPPDNDPNGAASDIVVLGRFNLRNPEDAKNAALRLRVTLFGVSANEKSVTTTVTRLNPQTQQKEREQLVLSADRPEQAIFSSAGDMLADYFRLLMQYLGKGFDQLFLLLLVLAAAAAGWRQYCLR
jgi:hypothetical protein